MRLIKVGGVYGFFIAAAVVICIGVGGNIVHESIILFLLSLLECPGGSIYQLRLTEILSKPNPIGAKPHELSEARRICLTVNGALPIAERNP